MTTVSIRLWAGISESLPIESVLIQPTDNRSGTAFNKPADNRLGYDRSIRNIELLKKFYLFKRNRTMRTEKGSKLLGIILLPFIGALNIACTSTPPSIDTSPTADVTYDGLHAVLNSSADKAWAKPGVDFSGYTKIKLESVGIEYRPGGEKGRTMMSRSRGGPYEVSEKQKVRFEKTVGEAFRDELAKSERFSIVDEAGPDVLLVRGALLDVVSYVPPDDNARRIDVYLSSVGEATMVLELRDSITNAILARAIDRDAAEDIGGVLSESNRVSNASEVRRVVRRWARSLREGLESFGN